MSGLGIGFDEAMFLAGVFGTLAASLVIVAIVWEMIRGSIQKRRRLARLADHRHDRERKARIAEYESAEFEQAKAVARMFGELGSTLLEIQQLPEVKR